MSYQNVPATMDLALSNAYVQEPNTDPDNGFSSSQNPLRKIFCCSNVNHHKIPISNNPASQKALNTFVAESGGALPHDVHGSSKKVYWWAFREIYGVVSHASRGSKKVKAVNFYGISIRRETKIVTLIPESAVQAEEIEVVGARKARDPAGGKRYTCLLREEGGMELSCKRHLDTIYTVYRVHYQGIQAVIGLRREENTKEADPPAQLRREYMQSNKELMVNLDPQLLTISQSLRPVSESTRLKSMASKALGKKPLEAEKRPPVSTTGLRTPSQTPEPIRPPPSIASAWSIKTPSSFGTPGSTPPPTTSASLPTANSKPDTPSIPAEVKMVKCPRHIWLVPETDFGINPKTQQTYKWCEKCRRKNRKYFARQRGEEVSDSE